MKSRFLTTLIAILWGIAFGPAFIPTAGGQTVDSWTNNTRGTEFKWETAAEWSLDTPPSLAQTDIMITNRFVGSGPFARTVSIDATTASGAPDSMTINNLTLSSPSTTLNNNLHVNSTGATPLTIDHSLTISSHGVVVITNSVVIVGTAGGTLSNDGSLLLNTGTLQTFFGCVGLCFPSATPTIIGSTSTGMFTVAAGRWFSGPVQVGSSLSSYGTLTISGGSITMATGFNVILPALNVVNGTVLLAGGVLQTSSDVQVGSSGGAGEVTVSNASWLSGNTSSIGVSGGDGTLTIAGGTVSHSQIEVGLDANSRGALWLTGGQLISSDIRLGRRGYGQMTVSNGSTAVSTIVLGIETGSAGTLTIAGGTCNVDSSMNLSAVDCTATGIVNITAGSLNVTNSAGNATLEVINGTLTLSGGTLRIDKLILTNACAHFVRTGGTLILNAPPLLDPTRDDDGDGISNGYEQSHGLDPLNPADANIDSDGDGLSNLQEFLAGTDATNSASVFRITSVATQGSDVLIAWMMGPGKTNALQAASGAGDGSYQTNGFATIFTVANTVGTTTNYLDVGGATNQPARYYRVRLVP
jgi:Bacterial TSP3 repeat